MADHFAVWSTPDGIDVRPGLTLRWGPIPSESLAGFVAAITYRIQPEPGCMRLTRPDRLLQKQDADAAVLITAEAATELLTGDTTAGAEALRRFVSGTDQMFEHPLTARARLAIESIRRCPFAGVCRTMALTARCHDLLVEFLTVWTAELRPAPASTPGLAEAVRLAAEILTRDLENPPMLAALAEQVGLSETSLKRAFPREFGTTVFGYLRQQRMETARRLIESGAATVLEAAAQVGYSNPSNFAAAFRREFGVNPKTHQIASRR